MGLLFSVALAAPAIAAGVQSSTSVGEVVVVARTPLSAAAPDAGGGAFTILRLDRPVGEGSSVLRGLEAGAPGVSLSDAQGSPVQQGLVYRGFQASPLQGASQGLAVYVDGVRFNQPFGDTVDWDLIPEGAVGSITLEGANPLFGLNALGGSVSVRLKTGFSDRGGAMEAAGGSFGLRSETLQYGRAQSDAGLFVAAAARDERGWRAFSPQRQRQLYADAGWRRGGWESHAGIILADNDLFGEGAAPVQLLAVDRRAVFTHPDETRNHFALLRLSTQGALSTGLSFNAVAYAGRLSQSTANGDTSDAAACATAPALLCLEADGPALTDQAGAAVPDVLAGGAYAQLNTTTTRTTSAGLAAHIAADGRLFGRPNNLIVGGSLDLGRTGFSAQTRLGALTADRGFGGPGVVIDQAGGPIAPVSLAARNVYAGLFAADALRLTPSLTLNASARVNQARLSLDDRLGTALTGRHRFTRIDPAASLTWRARSDVSLYFGYARASRAPTAAELSCASPDSPCSLTNLFVADPDLKPALARTVEAGLRGLRAGDDGVTVTWSGGVFRTQTDQDITLVMSTARGRGYFENIGRTRRQGVEAAVRVERGAWRAWANYALTEATFRSPLVLSSPDNPGADAQGRIFVTPGDRLPGVPRHRLNVGIRYAPDGWSLGAELRAASSQVFFGDEANLEPGLPGYAVADVDAAVKLSRSVELFLQVRNVTDRRYATFGTFARTAAVSLPEAPGASDPRSVTPGAPRSFLGGLRASF